MTDDSTKASTKDSQHEASAAGTTNNGTEQNTNPEMKGKEGDNASITTPSTSGTKSSKQSTHGTHRNYGSITGTSTAADRDDRMERNRAMNIIRKDRWFR